MKRINEDFYSSGFLHFDKNGECHDKKDIARVWHVVFKYPKDEDTTVIDGTTYLYCIVMTDKLTDHFWAVYPGNSDPKSAEKSLPEYIVKHLPTNETNMNDQNRPFLVPFLGGTIDEQLAALKKLIDTNSDNTFSEDEMKIIKEIYAKLTIEKSRQNSDDKSKLLSYRELENLLKYLKYDNISFAYIQKVEQRALEKLAKALIAHGYSKEEVETIINPPENGMTRKLPRPINRRYYPTDDFHEVPDNFDDI